MTPADCSAGVVVDADERWITRTSGGVELRFASEALAYGYVGRAREAFGRGDRAITGVSVHVFDGERWVLFAEHYFTAEAPGSGGDH